MDTVVCMFAQCMDTMPSVDSEGKRRLGRSENLEEEDGLIDFPSQQNKVPGH